MRKWTLVVSLLGLLVCAGGMAAAAGYRTTVGAGVDEIPLVVVAGTPYEMGYALGHLMKQEVRGQLERFLSATQRAEKGLYSDARLDAAWAATAPYTHPRFVEELRGLADGAGVPFDTVRREHMIPVVSDYACSGAALWGKATRRDVLYQFRNLDYTMGMGLQNFPCVVIYLPSEGVPHVNVTFAAFVGCNTGMNAEGIALTEMGDSPGRDRPFDLNGVPFTVLFRDLLYDARGLDDAVQMVTQAKRIKKYHYIIGDGKHQRAVKMLAHAPNLVIWRDNDPKDEVAPNILENVVYNCEGRDPIGWAHMKRYYGRYTADAVIQFSKAVGSQGGNLLNVVYDATNLELWVAYAHRLECAYRRPYVHIKMRTYLDFSRIPAGARVFKGTRN